MLTFLFFPICSDISLGCVTISFIIQKTNITLFNNNIFMLFLLLATLNFTLLSGKEILIPVWLDTLQRILRGIISGFIVIMGRNILVIKEDENKTSKDFSILSLTLLSLPFLIPIIFSLLNFNSRTSADFFASFIYSISLVVYFTSPKNNALKKSKYNIQHSVMTTNKLGIFLALISLIIINIYFFLSLMIIPAVKAKYFEYTYYLSSCLLINHTN